MKEQNETPVKYSGEAMKDLFDIEQGVERVPPWVRSLLGALLDRIIEKRIEYYIPIEDEEEGADGTLRDLST